MARFPILLVGLPVALASNAAGQAFLDEHQKQTGVGTLPNGIQIKICGTGTGNVSPRAGTKASLHYAGRTVTEYTKVPKGYTFASTYETSTPVNVAPTEVVPGLGFAMTIMREGDIFEVAVPSELGYGAQGTSDGVIGPDEVLIYTVQMLSVDPAGQTYRKLSNAPVGGCDPLPTMGETTGAPGHPHGLLGGIFIGIVGLIGLLAAGYYYYSSPQKAGGGSSSSKELPPGWTEMHDDGAGRTYFYNTLNGESVWTRPTKPAAESLGL